MHSRAVIGTLFLLVAVAAWAGKYKLAADAASAEFHAESSSDSAGTTLRTMHAWATVDTGCKPDKHGQNLGSDFHNGEVGKTKPVRIAAGEAFTFSIKYGESRFGETRDCGVTGTFTPAIGRRYLARLRAIHNTEYCELGVYDITDGAETQVDFSMPNLSCIYTLEDGYMKNGRAMWTKFEIKTTP